MLCLSPTNGIRSHAPSVADRKSNMEYGSPLFRTNQVTWSEIIYGQTVFKNELKRIFSDTPSVFPKTI